MRTLGAYRAALRAARAAAALFPDTMPGPTAVLRDNLRLAFGSADGRLVRAIYDHFAAAAIDLLFFRSLFDPARFAEHFAWEGDALDHYRGRGQGGAVFVTGHFGNWELHGASFRHLGIPLAPVARAPRPAALARALDRFRTGEGQRVIPKRNALPLALRAVREGWCVAFLMDQAAGRYGAPLPFFGRPAWTLLAPAQIAIKLGVPLYAGYSTRLSDGIRYRCHAEAVPVDGDAEGVTRRLNALFERWVRADPSQWWWFHRRFKPPKAERAGRQLTPAGVPVS